MTKEEFIEDVKLLNYSLIKREYYSQLVYNYFKLFQNRCLTYKKESSHYRVNKRREVISVGVYIGYDNSFGYVFIDIDSLYRFQNLIDRKKKIENIKLLIENGYRKNLQ